MSTKIHLIGGIVFYNSAEDAEAEKECYMTKFPLSVISNLGVKPRAVPMDSDNVKLKRNPIT